MKIVIAGTGAFGTALANTFQEKFTSEANKEHFIMLFGINEKEVNDINHNNKNSKYYSKLLNPNLMATLSPEEAFVDADIIILAVPSFAILKLLKESIIPHLNKSAHFINVAKGLDTLHNLTISETIKKVIPKNRLKSVMKLSGPSFAVEIIEGQPTFLSLACENIEYAKQISDLFSWKLVHIQPSNQLWGIEWSSILKNPYSVLMGIIDGLGYKVNTRAFIFTKIVAEINEFFRKTRQDKNIVISAAALGDLYLTSTSKKSRNYQTGFKIGKSNKVTPKILQTYVTVEGLKSIENILNYADKKKLDLKLLKLLYNITYKKEKPSETVEKYFEIYIK